MSDAVWLAIIGAVVMFIKEYFDRQRADKSEKKAEAMAAKVDKVEKNTDGLVKEISAAKLAQGTAEGTAVGLAQGRGEAVQPLTVQATDVTIKADAVTVHPPKDEAK